MKLVLIALAASSFFGVTATAPNITKLETPPAEVSFKEKVTPLLKKYCYNCHAGEKASKGLKLDSHAGVMKGTTYGKVVVATKPADSVLIKSIKKIPGGSAMPPSRRKMTDAEIKIISDWITEGAKNN